MARLGSFFITRHWRLAKLVIALFCLEFLLTIATLAFFGIADPDTYRTKLWQNGSDRGFNSDPSEILYSYANYRPISTPLVWSSYMTSFNVVIAVLSMFILLVKSVMFVMHTFLPLLSLLVHALLVALYAVSIHNQSAPDMTDPTKPSPGLPWYLSKGCSYADPGNKGYCMQARASFAVTCVMLYIFPASRGRPSAVQTQLTADPSALFATYLLLSIWSVIPTHRERHARAEDIELQKVSKYEPDSMSREEQREINRQLFLNLPKTPTTPFGKYPMTPRTVAFTQLSGESGPHGGGYGQQQQQQPPMPSTMEPEGELPLGEFEQGRVPDARQGYKCRE